MRSVHRWLTDQSYSSTRIFRIVPCKSRTRLHHLQHPRRGRRLPLCLVVWGRSSESSFFHHGIVEVPYVSFNQHRCSSCANRPHQLHVIPNHCASEPHMVFLQSMVRFASASAFVFRLRPCWCSCLICLGVALVAVLSDGQLYCAC